MGQSIEISDELMLDARKAAAAMERSVSEQVEHWARLGMILDRVMTGAQAGEFLRKVSGEEILARLNSVDTPEGRARLDAYFASKPLPRFRAHPSGARVYIREGMDGNETVGRFEGKEFVVLENPESDQ